MAKVVLGVGTSHTPMLLTPPLDWPKYEARDRKVELLDQEGVPRSYEELIERAGHGIQRALMPDALVQAYTRCQESLDRLGEAIQEASPDVIIIIGDDQKELFQVENLPAMLIYWGDTITNKLRRPKPGEPSWWSEALAKYYGLRSDESCPVASKLALHLIQFLVEQGFDLAQSKSLPEGMGEGHAFAFVHSRLLDHRPVPVVPVFLNTYYPPNQPTPRRCFHLGQAIRDAVSRFGGDERVAVVASGGLSHFVVDPELDQTVLEALATGDSATLMTLPQRKLNSGTSEVRNWITMYGASEHLSHVWTDYVPAYRTPAGTGTGCAFGVFR
jgi:hypothetical protein